MTPEVGYQISGRHQDAATEDNVHCLREHLELSHENRASHEITAPVAPEVVFDSFNEGSDPIASQ